MLDFLAREIDDGFAHSMRRLMLLRHAKSDWSGPPLRDQDRPLNARGRQAAVQMARYMAKHALDPDLVICSTAVRARETVDLGADAFPRKPRITYEARIYNADPETLLKVLRETRDSVHTLLMVGHNPGMQSLAELLIATGDIDSRQQLLAKFPTAGLAIIDFQIDDWRKVHPHAGRLDRFITPPMLVEASD